VKSATVNEGAVIFVLHVALGDNVFDKPQNYYQHVICYVHFVIHRYYYCYYYYYYYYGAWDGVMVKALRY
jgi:hypothetical protein